MTMATDDKAKIINDIVDNMAYMAHYGHDTAIGIFVKLADNEVTNLKELMQKVAAGMENGPKIEWR